MPDKENIYVRINGRGNAWPVFLGGTSNFYDVQSSVDLGNASFSLISVTNEKQVKWEILIDAGHHTVPFLINNGNRIPEAIVLTHGHMDHTLGIDWVAQSKYHQSNKKEKLALYATNPVWEFVKLSYPQLAKIIEFRELKFGVKTTIDEAGRLSVKAFPVYHGQSAKGASMLFFEYSDKSVLFTGDMLCSMLREKDYKTISKAKTVFIDANNRFPYPLSNHGSIVKHNPNKRKTSKYIEKWLREVNINYLLTPHDVEANRDYFLELVDDFPEPGLLPLTILEFAQKAHLSTVHLIHYGAMEDVKYYNQDQLSAAELEEWAAVEANVFGLKNFQFIVPETGHCYFL